MLQSGHNQPYAVPAKWEHVSEIAYRPDIDGLRGIAVLSVVGYHAFPSWITSGFIGVDIFFVISGFLISSIILRNLQTGRFGFLEFYGRRIKRILPALLLVLGITLAVGWFALLPGEYKQLGRHVAAASAFISNFVLWSEAGYFDTSAETKPLLHLWSLGIEEQFYLLWPLILWFSWKRRISALGVCLGVVAVSFAINVRTANSDTVAAFYSPLPRFWELTVGSLLAHLSMHKPRAQAAANRLTAILAQIACGAPAPGGRTFSRDVTATLGAALVGLSMFVIAKTATFPGYWALLPAIGTYLLLVAGPHSWFGRTVLSNRLLVGVGLISYPLYLWHWPVLTFARIIERQALNPGLRLAAVFLSFGLALLTYHWLEKPIRFGRRSRGTPFYLCVVLLLLGCAGYYSMTRDGFPARFGDKADYELFFLNTPPEFRYAVQHHLFEAYRDPCDFYDNRNVLTRVRDTIGEACYVPHTPYSILIWGDSHAQQLYYGLSHTLPKSISILQVTTSACIPSLTDLNPDPLSACNKSNTFARKVIAEAKPQTVLLAQAGGHTATDFDPIAVELKALGVRHVLLVGPVPQWNTALYKIILNDFWFSTPVRSFHALNQEILETNTILKKKYAEDKNLTYISLTDFFCNSAGCLLYIGKNRRDDIVTHDYGHLLPKTSEFLSRNLLAPIVIRTFPEFGPDGSATQLPLLE